MIKTPLTGISMAFQQTKALLLQDIKRFFSIYLSITLFTSIIPQYLYYSSKKWGVQVKTSSDFLFLKLFFSAF